LDALKQTSSVEDFADKFQSLVAEIVAMPPSEGDLLQKFRNSLKPDIQMVAGTIYFWLSGLDCPANRRPAPLTAPGSYIQTYGTAP
jgi:hypothetical protein